MHTQPMNPSPATTTQTLPATDSTAPDVKTRRRNRALLRTFAVIGVLFVGAGLALAGTILRKTARDGMVPQLADIADWNDLERYVLAEGEFGMTAQVGDTTVTFPALDVDITVDIQGDVANVTVVQTFSNPSPDPVHATYVFPLPSDAAVHAMTMEVGNERIRAQIDRIEEATATFEAAQEAGQAAALVTQERPNVFTQRVANLMPGLPVRVELQYVQTVPRVHGEYDLAVPLVVGPRFTPTGTGDPEAGDDVAYDEDGHAMISSQTTPAEWELDTVPGENPVFADGTADTRDRVSISVRLDGGTPVTAARSTTHPMRQDWHGASRVDFTLADGNVPDDRDFRFVYALGDDDVTAAVLAHHDERGGYFTLRLDPPIEVPENTVTPREMVFVLDTSGSMNGLPIEASKSLARRALRSLRPTDTFRVIQFGDSATEFAAEPLPATSGNIERAVQYVDAMNGMGGTQMIEGIHQALSPAIPDGSLRMVVFLTDGYIGNDHQVLSALDASIGDARLFAFGVGSAVNEFLLGELGRRGRGFTRFIDLDDDADAAVAQLAADLESPVLTHVSIDWGDIEVHDVYPREVRDVFAGRPIRVVGRYTGAQSGTVTVRGRVAGEPREIRVPVSLPSTNDEAGSDAVALLWAQTAIDDEMAALHRATARHSSAEAEPHKERVIALGLEHDLVTRWTAFVAVSETIVNEHPEDATESGVPTSMVHGLQAEAYGSSFQGTSAPEPFFWLALLTAGATTAASRRRRAA